MAATLMAATYGIPFVFRDPLLGVEEAKECRGHQGSRTFLPSKSTANDKEHYCCLACEELEMFLGK